MKTIQWLQNKKVIAATTLRNPQQPQQNNMALHTGGDIAAIIRNRQRLSESLGIDITDWVFAQQTHGDHIYKVEQIDKGKGALHDADAIQASDALYTKEKQIAIGIFHADCVPILLYDPFTSIICAIHSGWMGTCQEITRKTMQHLITHEGVNPIHMKAYIGPAIAYDSFEVGMDVVEKVQQMSFDTSPFIKYVANNKAFISTKGLNEAMLERSGVLRDNITVNLNDTFMKNGAFFSYRRDHTCGRHLSFIMMKESANSKLSE